MLNETPMLKDFMEVVFTFKELEKLSFLTRFGFLTKDESLIMEIKYKEETFSFTITQEAKHSYVIELTNVTKEKQVLREYFFHLEGTLKRMLYLAQNLEHFSKGMYMYRFHVIHGHHFGQSRDTVLFFSEWEECSEEFLKKDRKNVFVPKYLASGEGKDGDTIYFDGNSDVIAFENRVISSLKKRFKNVCSVNMVLNKL